MRGPASRLGVYSNPFSSHPATPKYSLQRAHIFRPEISRCLAHIVVIWSGVSVGMRAKSPSTPVLLTRSKGPLYSERTFFVRREAGAEPTGLCGDARARVASRGVQHPLFFPPSHPKVFVAASAHLAPREKQVPSPQAARVDDAQAGQETDEGEPEQSWVEDLRMGYRRGGGATVEYNTVSGRRRASPGIDSSVKTRSFENRVESRE
jgi:hypothetical protein